MEYVLHQPLDGSLPRDAVFLVKLIGEEVVGCLLVTFESSSKWWIQSVYVKEEHRRKKHFTSLFEHTIKLAKENGVDSIKLYAENDNERAKKTYFKLGMLVIPDKFYVYDFVLGGCKVEQFATKLTIQSVTQNEKAEEWCSQKKNHLNQLAYSSTPWNFAHEIREGEQVLGYAKCFKEFSDWRFGFIYYIRELYLRTGAEDRLQEVVNGLIRVLNKASEVPCAAVRVLFRGTIGLEGGCV